MKIRLMCWIEVASILLATGMGAVAQDKMDQRIDKISTTKWEPTSTSTSTRSFRQKKKKLPRWLPLNSRSWELLDK